jgi:hypothetical protein
VCFDLGGEVGGVGEEVAGLDNRFLVNAELLSQFLKRNLWRLHRFPLLRPPALAVAVQPPGFRRHDGPLRPRQVTPLGVQRNDQRQRPGVVAAVLLDRHRGLPGGDTLSRLLLRVVGPCVLDARAIAPPDLPPLTARCVLAWARAHRRLTGRWPGPKSGAVAGRPGETWKAIDRALLEGRRGLPPGGSLAAPLRGMGAGPAKRGPKPKRRG